MSKVVWAVAVALGVIYSLSPAGARADAGTASASEPGDLLATIDGEPITEASAGDAARAAIHQARTSLYDARRRAAEEAIATILLEREAKRRGINVEQLLELEVSSKVGQIPPQEVKDFYVANRARIRQPFEAVAPEIEQYLKNQRAASWRASLVTELKKGSTIAFVIEPPRVPVSATGPAKGPATAPVTIVEFSDFQCPFCAQAVAVLRQVAERYGEHVRIVYRDFPLDTIHPQARKAAEAARCAGAQGKFWEYHDKLFANQQALEVVKLAKYAEELGMDGAAFSACLSSSRFQEAVERDVQDGQRAGIGGTPTFFINGRPFVGVPSFDAMRSVIDEELQRVAARDARPKSP